jgi:hypothetical protein
VSIIEVNADVIALVGPVFKDDARVSIIHADAFEYRPAKGVKFDFIWHDIWPCFGPAIVEDIRKLERKFRLFAKRQDSWTKGFSVASLRALPRRMR